MVAMNMIQELKLPPGTLVIAGLRELEDEATPLVGQPLVLSWSLLNLLLAAATVLLMVLAVIDYKKSSFRMISIIPGMLAVVIFFLTEDVTRVVGIVDQWTVWMAAILLLQIIVLFLSERKHEKREGAEHSA